MASEEQTREQPRSWLRAQAARGKAAHALAWQLARRHPQVVLWRVLGLGAGSLLSTMALVAILLAVFAQLRVLEPALGVWAAALVELARQPGFTVSAWGMFAAVTAMTWLADAYTEGLIWASWERDQGVEAAEDGWQRAAHHAPTALAWVALRKLSRLAMALMGAMVYVSLLRVTMRGGVWTPALTLGLVYALGILYVALLNVALEWMPAERVTGAPNLGEAALGAARAAIEELVSSYRLLIHALGLAVVPLLVYMASVTLEVWALTRPELAAAAGLVRVLSELFLFIALTMVGLLFRAGTLFLAADRRGDLGEDLEILAERARAEKTRRTTQQPSPLAQFGQPRDGAPAQVAIEDLIPDELPNLIDARELLAAAQQPAREEE